MSAASGAAAVAPLTALFEQRLGLVVESLGGVDGLAKACAQRATRLGLGDVAAYVARVLIDPFELDALVDALVVPETWFFRDGAPFLQIAQRAVTARRRDPRAPFRVLSVPCATGEEPFSVAIALLEAGVPADGFAIVACDISKPLLERARRGRYGAWSFRGDTGAIRERWFVPVEDRWEVLPVLTRLIEWRHGNVMDPQLLAGESRFDVVLCRNLLIYLSAAARVTVVGRLLDKLDVDGVIVAGHAENLASIDRRLRLVEGTTFVWQPVDDPRAPGAAGPGERRKTARLPAVPRPGSSPPSRSSERRIAARPPTQPLPTLAPPPAPPAPAAAPAATSLARARALADAGALPDALRACVGHLVAFPADADGHYLRGALLGATGDAAGAEQSFGRAVYLAPRHYPALIQLALLCEARGDAAAATNYRRRAAAAIDREGGGE